MISFKINPETLNVSIHGTLAPSKMAEVLNRALIGDPDAESTSKAKKIKRLQSPKMGSLTPPR